MMYTDIIRMPAPQRVTSTTETTLVRPARLWQPHRQCEWYQRRQYKSRPLSSSRRRLYQGAKSLLLWEGTAAAAPAGVALDGLES